MCMHAGVACRPSFEGWVGRAGGRLCAATELGGRGSAENGNALKLWHSPVQCKGDTKGSREAGQGSNKSDSSAGRGC